MQRTVQLFIHQGRIEKVATRNADGTYTYGQIKVTNSVCLKNLKEPNQPFDPNKPIEDQIGPEDRDGLIVHTHYRHSFLRDAQNNPLYNVDNGKVVYFFLVPMEYLFSTQDLPADSDSPLLAVNVNNTYPFAFRLFDGAVTRKPCTTVSTIEGDNFETYPPTEVPVSIFLMSPFYLDYFIRSIFHHRRRFFYGINDFGELTIIDIREDECIANRIGPWTKIWLKPKNFPKSELFSHVYSPKNKDKRKYVEHRIPVQKFDRLDDGWAWVIDKPFGPQPGGLTPIEAQPKSVIPFITEPFRSGCSRFFNAFIGLVKKFFKDLI